MILHAVLVIGGKRFVLNAGELYIIGHNMPSENPRVVGLEEKCVDEKHACIEMGEDCAYVFDLMSTSGTFVNGVRLEGLRKVRLADIVSLDVGDLAGSFEITASDQLDDSSDFSEERENSDSKPYIPDKTPQVTKVCNASVDFVPKHEISASTTINVSKAADSFADSFFISATQFCQRRLPMRSMQISAAANNSVFESSSFSRDKDELCIPVTHDVTSCGKFQVCTQEYNKNTQKDQLDMESCNLLEDYDHLLGLTQVVQSPLVLQNRIINTEEILRNNIQSIALQPCFTNTTLNDNVDVEADRDNVCTPDLFDELQSAQKGDPIPSKGSVNVSFDTSGDTDNVSATAPVDSGNKVAVDSEPQSSVSVNEPYADEIIHKNGISYLACSDNKVMRCQNPHFFFSDDMIETLHSAEEDSRVLQQEHVELGEEALVKIAEKSNTSTPSRSSILREAELMSATKMFMNNTPAYLVECFGSVDDVKSLQQAPLLNETEEKSEDILKLLERPRNPGFSSLVSKIRQINEGYNAVSQDNLAIFGKCQKAEKGVEKYHDSVNNAESKDNHDFLEQRQVDVQVNPKSPTKQTELCAEGKKNGNSGDNTKGVNGHDVYETQLDDDKNDNPQSFTKKAVLYVEAKLGRDFGDDSENFFEERQAKDEQVNQKSSSKQIKLCAQVEQDCHYVSMKKPAAGQVNPKSHTKCEAEQDCDTNVNVAREDNYGGGTNLQAEEDDQLSLNSPTKKKELTTDNELAENDPNDRQTFESAVLKNNKKMSIERSIRSRSVAKVILESNVNANYRSDSPSEENVTANPMRTVNVNIRTTPLNHEDGSYCRKTFISKPAEKQDSEYKKRELNAVLGAQLQNTEESVPGDRQTLGSSPLGEVGKEISSRKSKRLKSKTNVVVGTKGNLKPCSDSPAGEPTRKRSCLKLCTTLANDKIKEEPKEKTLVQRTLKRKDELYGTIDFGRKVKVRVRKMRPVDINVLFRGKTGDRNRTEKDVDGNGSTNSVKAEKKRKATEIKYKREKKNPNGDTKRSRSIKKKTDNGAQKFSCSSSSAVGEAAGGATLVTTVTIRKQKAQSHGQPRGKRIRLPSNTAALEQTRSLNGSPVTDAKVRVSISSLNPELSEKLRRTASGIWTEASNPVDSDYLVMGNGNRTIKFLVAMARGIPIVNSKWLEFVNKTNAISMKEEHLFSNPDFERHFKFSMQKSLEIARTRKIFAGYEFVMTPNTRPNLEDMKMIIHSAGGVLLDKMPPPMDDQKVYLISCLEDKKLWHKYRRVNSNTSIIATEGVMSAVTQQSIEPLDAHQLC